MYSLDRLFKFDIQIFVLDKTEDAVLKGSIFSFSAFHCGTLDALGLYKDLIAPMSATSRLLFLLKEEQQKIKGKRDL